MKLVHPTIERHIDFCEDSVNLLIVENRNAFTHYVSELYEQIHGGSGDFVLSENFEIQDMSKKLDLITSYVPFLLNKKELLSALYKKLAEKAVDEDFYVKTQNLSAEVEHFLIELTTDEDAELEFHDFNITTLFKTFNLTFCESYGSLCEKILQYMFLVRELCGERCYIFVDLKSYLSDEDLAELYSTALGHKMKLLLIESTERKYRHDCESITIIDEDLCEI